MKKNSKKQFAVRLKNVNKVYTLHHEKPTLIEQIIKFGEKEEFVALDDINLNIEKGEKVGIIGTNGSGKTTLLKLICKISTPNSGTVTTEGKIISLIELTAGFHLDLTGRENVFLNGLIIGMSKKEISQKYDEIVKFANIGNFINSSLYTYSEGMKLRLGFSIAIHANPDVLVLDESIVAGDENFQIKSGEKIEELFNNKKTIIMTTHYAKYLKDHCTKIVWINKGKIKKIGGISLIDEYVRQKRK